MDAHEPIHVTVAGSGDDPRSTVDPPGVVIHRVPALHPDDVVTLPNGLRVTSVARTLVDCAQTESPRELCAMFRRAQELGLLDLDAVDACIARLEWRPSTRMLNAVIAEFRARQA
ncbi:hypothetical protein DSM104329_02887 [Capillimicrobium parvum]|uniref:Uncharacterized protein n=2 Tax=Capillimicrobium parvum TaxID=2884022 RepID=A0A9E7C0K5_9ACTN|nr:hypothetical protein DSM104329_02887 [Capillimicrobium parvum]